MKVTDEMILTLINATKEKLRECAIKQRRINGKFASNIYDNSELLGGKENG